jgi:hypothetical protein
MKAAFIEQLLEKGTAAGIDDSCLYGTVARNSCR